MNRTLSDLEELESGEYQVACRRSGTCSRPPRRESPRFASQRAKHNEGAGIHRRGNKRSGL